MAIGENLETWQGKPVEDWPPVDSSVQSSSRFQRREGRLAPEDSPALNADTAYRIRLDWGDEESWTDHFADFLAHPGVSEVTALVVGVWGGLTRDGGTADEMVQAIVGARSKLPNLTALFIGDITFEESEISWIAQTDLSPLLTAYPNLEHFAARGGQGLSLGVPKLTHLKSLVIEAGGLPSSVIEEVSIGDLPALEHLELYLGSEEYGGDSSVDDLQTILYHGPDKWPKLTYLGLRDCEYADALAEALTKDGGVPLLKQIQTLDLSLGTLGDDGVRALIACPAVTKLKKLDIHYHFASEETVALLTALGIEVDASDPQDEEEEEGRYVAVAE